jgi:hypothetical protein
MGMSRREYADHRGVTHMAVNKAINAGRIPLTADGTIDPEVADRAWKANTRPNASNDKRAARKAKGKKSAGGSHDEKLAEAVALKRGIQCLRLGHSSSVIRAYGARAMQPDPMTVGSHAASAAAHYATALEAHDRHCAAHRSCIPSAS